jgi:hypothetical protein
MHVRIKAEALNMRMQHAEGGVDGLVAEELKYF